MTTKQLIKKLSKFPDNTRVLFSNSRMYNEGYYEVTEIDDWSEQDGAVVLDSNYKRNFADD